MWIILGSFRSIWCQSHPSESLLICAMLLPFFAAIDASNSVARKRAESSRLLLDARFSGISHRPERVPRASRYAQTYIIFSA